MGMKILQLNATPFATSIKQLNFYQDQNNYIIALQEANSKERSFHLKIGKQKVTPPSWIKNLGMEW